MSELTGKVAIITGSTSGMGEGTAYYFAQQGAKVVVVGRREDRAKKVVEKIKADGGEAIYVICDMADPSQIGHVVDKTLEAYGTVDVLYNNAGAITMEPTTTIGLEEWNRLYQINVTAYLLMSQKVAPIMKEKGKGAIINTGSIAGTSSRWGASAYCTTKHAVNGLTKALARDLGPEIRVNAILPGAINSEMLEGAGGPDGEAVAPMKEMSPLKRIGEPIDIARVAEFLATDASAFITGQCIRVDGGVDA